MQGQSPPARYQAASSREAQFAQGLDGKGAIGSETDGCLLALCLPEESFPIERAGGHQQSLVGLHTIQCRDDAKLRMEFRAAMKWPFGAKNAEAGKLDVVERVKSALSRARA